MISLDRLSAVSFSMSGRHRWYRTPEPRGHPRSPSQPSTPYPPSRLTTPKPVPNWQLPRGPRAPENPRSTNQGCPCRASRRRPGPKVLPLGPGPLRLAKAVCPISLLSWRLMLRYACVGFRYITYIQHVGGMGIERERAPGTCTF